MPYMEGQPVKASQIFKSFLKVGFIGFGGGSALIPIIERELVLDKGYLTREDYLQHTVIANITPGALPVKLGATCGQKLGGTAGSLAGAYAVMLPGVVLTAGIMALFSLLGAGAIHCFNFASVGITAFIVFLLTSYIARTVGGAARAVNLTLCALAFAATGGKELRELAALAFGLGETATPLLDISTIHLMIVAFFLIVAHAAARGKRLPIAAAAAMGAAYTALSGKRAAAGGWVSLRPVLLTAMLLFLCALLLVNRPRKRNAAKLRVPRCTLLVISFFLLLPVLVTALVALITGERSVFAFIGQVCVSTVTSFGGGEAYISVADGLFVQSGFLAPELFYARLVPVANALPGPILVKTAAGIGFLHCAQEGAALAGWGFAAAAAFAATGVCSAVAVAMLQAYDAVRESALVSGLKRYILPVVCGMLLSTACAMLVESMRVMGEAGVAGGASLLAITAWVAGLHALTRKRHINDLLLLFGSAGISLLGLTLLAA